MPNRVMPKPDWPPPRGREENLDRELERLRQEVADQRKRREIEKLKRQRPIQFGRPFDFQSAAEARNAARELENAPAELRAAVASLSPRDRIWTSYVVFPFGDTARPLFVHVDPAHTKREAP